jgi:uncharacterized protein YjgD (DUF1641 family)
MARQLMFHTDMSELDLSASGADDTFSAAKRSPRGFDVNLTTIFPLGPSSVRKEFANQTNMMTDISERLSLSQKYTASFREQESRIRHELEKSKVALIEQFQINEAKLTTELASIKGLHEQHLKEKETMWNERDSARLQDIQRLEQKLADLLELSRKRLAEKERVVVEQLERQEEVWKQRLQLCVEENEEQMQTLRDKLAQERDSQIVAEKARLAAKEDQAKSVFEAKLKAYEQEIHEVMRNYRDKELIIHGSLDEARKEIVLMRNSWSAKEESLRSELAAKDRIINRLQSKLHLVDDITKVADSWRGVARDLARIVVNACVTIQDMPPLPTPPADTVPSLILGYGKEDEGVLRQRQAYAVEAKAYYRTRREHVMIHKDLVGRALRNSKVRTRCGIFRSARCDIPFD